MTRWVQGRVAGRRQWTENLFSLAVDAPEVTFIAGQFARLALPAPPGSPEPMLGRPYSFANPPGTPLHDFYIASVAEGPLSPRLARLEPGEPVWLLPTANGFFTVAEVPSAATLWCLATGTGIAPFLSILRTEEPWQRFGQVVLVHAVRLAVELTYRDEIAAIGDRHPGRFAFVPIVSREAVATALSGRIPAAIDDGRLEARAGVALHAATSQVMLCGNPAMVTDTQQVLLARGMKRHRRRAPGQVTAEAFW